MSQKLRPRTPTPDPRRPSDAQCWRAIETRDRAYDGQFYFSVSTTGIYCRPSCPARHAKRVNVAFHSSRDAAEAAGYRPCKRCKPEAEPPSVIAAAKVSAACRRIETAEREPPLKALALEAGFSPFHFQRMFKDITGVTPKGYAIAHRQKQLRANLEPGKPVTDAIYDAGFNSSGRAYASTTKALGMRPSEFRSGGANTEMNYAVGTSSLGPILVAASSKGITAILFGDDAGQLLDELRRRFPKATLQPGDKSFARLVAKTVASVEAPEKSVDLPLDVRGTAFQHRVWQALQEIPAGTTVTYSDIAARIGAPKAVRAVAGACAANKIAVVIPCHRVIRNDGSLSGYRWGLDRKRKLIAREAKRQK